MVRVSLILVCGLLTASAASAQQMIGSCPLFPADNVWNTPVDTLAVLPNSASMVATIGSGTGLYTDFGSGTWNGGPIGIPFIRVSGSQAKYPGSFQYAFESDPGPYAIPLNAPIEGGSASTGDRHAIALDTDNCILYEMFYAFPQTASWRADSGAIFNLRSNALRPSGWTSADAAGFAILPGLVTYDEVMSGEIKHAIRFTASRTRREFVWPARHFASSLTGSEYPRMGERFRLKASFDISTYPAQAQVILRAMKKYGIILADNGSNWFISGAPDSRWNNDVLRSLRTVVGSNFEAVNASVLMIDPNSGAARQPSGGGTQPPTQPPPSDPVSVSISPTSTSVRVDRGRQFTADVDNTTNTKVTWKVNGVAGGNGTVGTISASGYYRAPSRVPSPSTVTVSATPVADPAKTASASVRITRY